jgi:O-antigen/teichoic acid export membrane protein
MWKVHLKESAFFAINNLLITVYVYIPIILLGFLSTPEKLGIFSAPHRLVYTLINFTSVVPRAFYPVLASLYQNIEAFKKANYNFQKIMVAVGLPIGVGGALLAKAIIELLYGSSYLEGTDILKVLVWAVPMAFIKINYNSALLVLGLQRLNVIANGLGFLTMLLFNFWSLSRTVLTTFENPPDNTPQIPISIVKPEFHLF